MGQERFKEVRPVSHIFIRGHKMVVHDDDVIISARLRRGVVYERSSINLVESRIQPGQTFVNVGANIGYFTLILARLVGVTGHGYAFEPEPDNFKLLAENVKLNGYENITIINSAVSNATGTLTLYLNDKQNRGDHRIWDNTGARVKTTVDVVTLDEYLSCLDEHIDFIKMDVQGAEAGVIEGAERILDEDGPMILMEFWPWGLRQAGHDPIDMINGLVRHGYSIFDMPGDGTLHRISVSDLQSFPSRHVDAKNIWLEKRI